jgi:glutamate-1-semialdehyde 2,1-aminomutase
MREVIDIIHRHGALVIFDEMMSGFRVAPGGMQELWNVKPDISCFGKSIANGLPLSILCGKSEYIRRLPETYYGMTFEGEAVSIAAACATLNEVIQKDVVTALYEKGRQIRAAYDRTAGAFGLSTALAGYEPCMHIDFQKHGRVSGRELLWLFIQELVKNGVLTFGAFILCYTHDRRDLRKIETATEQALSAVRKAVDRRTTEGMLDPNVRERLDLIDSPAQWRQASAT